LIGPHGESEIFSGRQIYQVDQKLEDLMSEVLQIPLSTITDDLSMKSLDVWDSLKHMEVIVSLEEKFDIQLTFDEIVKMQSVREIRSVLRAKGAAG